VTASAPQALVTGASRGIGKAIAIGLAEAGYDVAIAARTLRADDPTQEHSQTVHKKDTRPLPGSIELTAAEIEKRGRRALPLRMDLTDLASVEAACESLLAEWDGVDVVVNNGRHIGPGLMDNILDTPIDQYPLYMAAHGTAPIRITQLLLPSILKRGGGTFITTSSNAGYDWYPDGPRPGLGYRIGKAAGHALVGSIQAEYGGQGVRAFNVNPGFTLTERNSLDAEEFGFDPRTACPPQAIAAVMVWLITAPEAVALQRQNVEAQDLALERGLYPDWRNG
jgi:NAD(P)-dependent dehydrogenase (short-subunit alcohol dehydrogenase family)